MYQLATMRTITEHVRNGCTRIQEDLFQWLTRLGTIILTDEPARWDTLAEPCYTRRYRPEPRSSPLCFLAVT